MFYEKLKKPESFGHGSFTQATAKKKLSVDAIHDPRKSSISNNSISKSWLGSGQDAKPMCLLSSSIHQRTPFLTSFDQSTVSQTPLQRKLADRNLENILTQNSPSIHSIAAQGMQGAGQRLPYFDKLQKAFEPHDLSHVRAYADLSAARANRDLNAEAFAMGNKVAFANPNPSLATVAHEATHIIQQRAGVHLKGGVGQEGDIYEKQANAVADKVSKGQSAENLLSSPLTSSSVNSKGNPYQAISGAYAPVQLATVPQPMGDPTGSKTQIDVIEVPAQEKVPDPANPANQSTTITAPITTKPKASAMKTTELSALLMPADPNLMNQGKPTTEDVAPMGWRWVKQTETYTRRSRKGKVSTKVHDFVKFHLLNAQLGGRGDLSSHLVPARGDANKKWDKALEETMKDEVAGRLTRGGKARTFTTKKYGPGTPGNFLGDPLYYKVDVRYYTLAEAPANYDMSQNSHLTPPNSGTEDYRTNIELIPKEIEAICQKYDAAKGWVDILSTHTYKLDQNDLIPPATIEERQGGLKFKGELTTAAADTLGEDFAKAADKQDMKNGFSNLFGFLQSQYRKQAPTKYSEIRQALETWAADGSFGDLTNRSRWIYGADNLLRAALTGLAGNSLTIHGSHIPDDGITKPHKFGKKLASPEEIKKYTTNQAIISGYANTAQVNKSKPPMETVLKTVVYSYSPDTLVKDINTAWRQFINDSYINFDGLPPMTYSNFSPKDLELETTIFNAMKDQLHSHIQNIVVDKHASHSNKWLFIKWAQEMERDIEKIYWRILDPIDPLLTKGIAVDVRPLFNFLRTRTPELEARMSEFEKRMSIMDNAHKSKPTISDGKIMQGIQGSMFDYPLGVSIANIMQTNFEKEKRELDLKQPTQSERVKVTKAVDNSKQKTDVGSLKVKKDIVKDNKLSPNNAMKLMTSASIKAALKAYFDSQSQNFEPKKVIVELNKILFDESKKISFLTFLQKDEGIPKDLMDILE